MEKLQDREYSIYKDLQSRYYTTKKHQYEATSSVCISPSLPTINEARAIKQWQVITM